MAALFTEEQRSHLHALVEGSDVSATWLKAIRTSWKKIAAELKDYEGRIDHHPDITLKVLEDALRASRKALRLLGNYVDHLSEDLLINKGMWTLPSKAGAQETNETQRWKTQVIMKLDAAQEVVNKYTALNADKQKKVAKGAVPESEYAMILARAYTYVEKAVTQVHEAVMKVLSTLSKVEGQHAAKGKKLDLGGFAPEVHHIGPTTIVFDDLPSKKPSDIGSQTTTQSPKGKSYAKKEIRAIRFDHKNRQRMLYRHPKHREEYLPLIKAAHDMLRSADMEWLAYGFIRVRPEGSTHYTNTQAAYARNNDTVYIYCEPKPSLPGSIVHEYGHRYWYKFMTEQDRQNFSKWFGKVPAVSTYGGTATWEDFAEVFKHYVERRTLTKDQRERFTQFMRGKRPKVESIEESTASKAQKCKYCDRPAERSLIWADGRAYIPVCRAHDQKARNQIRSQNDSVCDVVKVEQGPFPSPSYTEHTFMPGARMEQALRPALDFVEDERPGTYFGRRADARRMESAFQEAPEDTTPRAPIGRRGTPRGAVHTTHTGPDIMGVTGKPVKRVTSGKAGKGTSGYTRKVQKPDREVQEIPDSLLQMLGTDWKTMRAFRVHDNRMTVNIDGVRFSVYTRRG